jgi:hypothetical protein
MATMTEAMDWDDEAQAEALFQARQMQVRDPEGAAMLLATLVITQDLQEQQGEPVERGGDYEPIKIYDFLCKEYGWTPKDIDEMHYLTAFAMLNQANDRHRREQDDMDNAMRK